MLLDQIISIMPMFVCLFWAIVLMADRRAVLAKRYLSFFFLVISVNYFVHATFFSHQYSLYAFMDNIWMFTSTASFPLFYYYIRLLTIDLKIDYRWVWILAPAVLISIFSFTLYYLMSPDELTYFVQGIMYRQSELDRPESYLIDLQILKNNFYKIVFVSQAILTLFHSSKLINKYNEEVQEFYSARDGRDMRMFKWVVVSLIFISIVSALSSVLGREFFVNKDILLIVPSVFFSSFLFFIGYIAVRQNFTIREFLAEVDKYNHNEKLDQDEDEYENNFVDIHNPYNISVEQLNQLMKEAQLFKRSDLKITDVAHQLNTNRTYVSKIINDVNQTNFNDWVNGYRVEEAERLLKDDSYSKLSMLEISEMSGFASISAFYRVFKEKTGLSPGKYRSQ